MKIDILEVKDVVKVEGEAEKEEEERSGEIDINLILTLSVIHMTIQDKITMDLKRINLHQLNPTNLIKIKLVDIFWTEISVHET